MNILKAGVSPLLTAVGLLKPKARKLPAPTPTITRDDAREQVLGEDALRRRRGGAADLMTGSSGAEAGATAKDTLGS